MTWLTGVKGWGSEGSTPLVPGTGGDGDGGRHDGDGFG